MRFKSSAFIVVALMLITPAAWSAQREEIPEGTSAAAEWEIPFLNTLTGPIASIGEYLSWSADKAVAEINAAGGINGAPVRIVHIDTGVSPEKAALEMARIADTALVALGPVPEACILSAMPIAVQNEFLSMTASTTYEYAVEFFPWSISWYLPTETILPPVTEAWAGVHPDMKHVVQFLEKWACWPVMAESHKEGLQNARVTVTDVEVPLDAVTFGPLVVKALKENPDGILLSVNAEKAAKIVLELKSRGWDDMSKILVFISADDAPFYTTGGENINGVMIYNLIDPNRTTERWLRIVEAFKKDFNGLEPFALVTHYYDAVYMIKEAIEATGVTGDPALLKEERIKVRDYCHNVKGFQGVMFEWDMKDGVPTNKPAFLFRIEDNKKVLVHTIEP